jgi:replicative DNA helicase
VTTPAKFQMLGPALSAAMDRSPPCSEEAEEHVLACCMIDGQDTIARALAEGLKPESFYFPRSRIAFEVIVELFRRCPPVTVEMLIEELRTRRQLDAVGGMPYIMQITGKIPTTAHAGYFIEKVREKAALRWLVKEASGMVEGAYAFAGPQEGIERGLEDVFRKNVSTLSRGLHRVISTAEIPLTMAEEIDAQAAEFKARAEGTADKSGWCYTGWKDFDEVLMPFGSQSDDHYIVVGGGSGDGKSALMRQWAGVALDRKQRVRVYTAETSVGGFIASLVASKVGVDLKHPELAQPAVQEKFMAECARLKNECADKTLWCVQQTGATPLSTIEDLEQDARMFARLQGPPHLWVVDYAQLFGTKKRCSNRESENAYVSGILQKLARSLGGVWLVGCQLNEAGLREMRKPQHDDKGRLIHRMPNRGDLRESQKYYHDADRVIFIYRPPEDCRGADNTASEVSEPEQWVVQDKRRKGGKGYVRRRFVLRLTRFEEIRREDITAEQHRQAQQTGKVAPGQRVAKDRFLGGGA